MVLTATNSIAPQPRLDTKVPRKVFPTEHCFQVLMHLANVLRRNRQHLLQQDKCQKGNGHGSTSFGDPEKAGGSVGGDVLRLDHFGNGVHNGFQQAMVGIHGGQRYGHATLHPGMQ